MNMKNKKLPLISEIYTYMADKLYYGWLLAYLSTSPNFGAGLVLKKLGPHTNLKTDIECLCSTIVYFISHGHDLVSLKFRIVHSVFAAEQSVLLDGAQQYPSMGINGSCRKLLGA